MEIRFKIHYQTVPGQNIFVCGQGKQIGNWDSHKAIKMNYIHDGFWELDLEVPKTTEEIEYKYLIKEPDGSVVWEWGAPRKINTAVKKYPVIYCYDNWFFPSNQERVMYSSAFSQAIMLPVSGFKIPGSKAKKVLQFKMTAPRVGKGYQLCVSGNQKALGNWDKTTPFLLGNGNDFPVWTGSINANEVKFPIQYKYGIYDLEKKEIVSLEAGFDRQIDALPKSDDDYVFIKSDNAFQHPTGNWKGAGVAVPVFALRSDKGFGVGEFPDLIDFIDWAKHVGMKMVQLLPVNETIASHSWLDSYPYKSISVVALHPIYLNIHKMGILKDKKAMAEFEAQKEELNKIDHVDYPVAHRIKSKYYKLLFDQEKTEFFELPEYKLFYEKNKDWLVPYAAFVYLRDKMKSPDFRTWKKFSQYNKKAIEKLSSPQSSEWDDIAIHYFIQFHLDKQLKEVAEYARSQGIVLKGDIPIGISPNSMEAWTEPHLFNLEAQAGAPPDSFAIKGQNWGFPTYNWEIMSKDNFAWWRMRLQKMAEYFDAYRIDHILGFFRIWEIPNHAVEGVLGAFNPALPMSASEIEHFGIGFDYERMVKPYIRHHLLHGLFGEYTGEVIQTFLENTGYGSYKIKEEYDTQVKVNNYFLKNKEEEDLDEKEVKVRNGLFDLIANVLFVQTGYDQYHPRITLQNISSFADLDQFTKNCLNELYNHFFYKRHDAFWYQKGMEKLPAIVAASNMLVCGEDLGMVPDCVHPVMDRLGILSLEIQRMSKNPKIKFAHPADAPYLSVCTPSTHDMSTIRGWWEEDRDTTQLFYNQQLGIGGPAPQFAEPWICIMMIKQHLYSPAMWTVFPVQDLIAMDGGFRWEKTHLEKINEPSNVRHRWRYRMHQSIDALKNAEYLNNLIRSLIEESGRLSDY
jgi:4-alpha-glucanotransferase